MNSKYKPNLFDYIGYYKQPLTPLERKRLENLRACNDNDLNLCQLREKAALLGKKMEEYKNEFNDEGKDI